MALRDFTVCGPDIRYHGNRVAASHTLMAVDNTEEARRRSPSATPAPGAARAYSNDRGRNYIHGDS